MDGHTRAHTIVTPPPSLPRLLLHLLYPPAPQHVHPDLRVRPVHAPEHERGHAVQVRKEVQLVDPLHDEQLPLSLVRVSLSLFLSLSLSLAGTCLSLSFSLSLSLSLVRVSCVEWSSVATRRVHCRLSNPSPHARVGAVVHFVPRLTRAQPASLPHSLPFPCPSPVSLASLPHCRYAYTIKAVIELQQEIEDDLFTAQQEVEQRAADLVLAAPHKGGGGGGEPPAAPAGVPVRGLSASASAAAQVKTGSGDALGLLLAKYQEQVANKVSGVFARGDTLTHIPGRRPLHPPPLPPPALSLSVPALRVVRCHCDETTVRSRSGGGTSSSTAWADSETSTRCVFPPSPFPPLHATNAHSTAPTLVSLCVLVQVVDPHAENFIDRYVFVCVFCLRVCVSPRRHIHHHRASHNPPSCPASLTTAYTPRLMMVWAVSSTLACPAGGSSRSGSGAPRARQHWARYVHRQSDSARRTERACFGPCRAPFQSFVEPCVQPFSSPLV